jgi:hypothetical protein
MCSREVKQNNNDISSPLNKKEEEEGRDTTI